MFLYACSLVMPPRETAISTMMFAMPVAAEPATMKMTFWSLRSGTPLMCVADASDAAVTDAVPSISSLKQLRLHLKGN